MTRHQYYYRPKGKRQGRKPSETTIMIINEKTVRVNNEIVITHVKKIQTDPDTDYGYHKMTTALMIAGYHINHKKVYRLMKEAQLLKDRHKRTGKTFAKYRTVMPDGPLEVLEMDIKQVWVTQQRRYAYILTVIDTFTRHALHWQMGLTMRNRQVRTVWEQVIADHLQPADMLNREIHIEVRSDNGPQFAATQTRQFFADNHLNHVFTHPYTPQENGHVESFHAILSNALGKRPYWSLEELETRLTVFYEKYNNVRLHGSIANLPPRLFWDLWENGKIERKVLKNRRIKFTLNFPYQQLSGNESLKGSPCLDIDGLDANQYSSEMEATGPGTLQQPSVKRSPSVVLADAKLQTTITTYQNQN